MKIIACGGRDYQDWQTVYNCLDMVQPRITCLVQGGARGADRIAARWAVDRGVRGVTFLADWDAYGKRAGHIRNAEMLASGGVECVVAFPGGAGTANMMKIAREAVVPVPVIDIAELIRLLS